MGSCGGCEGPRNHSGCQHFKDHRGPSAQPAGAAGGGGHPTCPRPRGPSSCSPPVSSFLRPAPSLALLPLLFLFPFPDSPSLNWKSLFYCEFSRLFFTGGRVELTVCLGRTATLAFTAVLSAGMKRLSIEFDRLQRLSAMLCRFQHTSLVCLLLNLFLS